MTGTWQEYLVTDTHRLLPVPDYLSDSSACQLAVMRRRAAVEDLVQRVAEIAGPTGVLKAIDCVADPVGAQVSQALAPHGELVVYGALSTHRQTDPAALTIPLQARSVIYETKTVRGFWLNRWFGSAAPEETLHALAQAGGLVADGVPSIPQGRPFPLVAFAEAVALAGAPAHSTRPPFVFDDRQGEHDSPSEGASSQRRDDVQPSAPQR
ncbi:zinc-binding dehydrogenase [Streptomyces collinus]